MVVNVVIPVKQGQVIHRVRDAHVITHVRMGQMVAIAKGANVIAP